MLSTVTQSTLIQSTTIQQWEEANALLANACSRFVDLSTLLLTQYTAHDKYSGDLAARIDSSFDYFQTVLDRQLVFAQAALAKTRNNLASCILSLPRETLSQIFLDVVFDPKDERYPSTGTVHIEHRVALIYHRLYSLIGVCAAWKEVALNCRALWSVVSLADPFSGKPRPISTNLSLERAGEKGLCLVAPLAEISSRGLRPLGGQLSRFSIFNIWEYPNANVSLPNFLEMLLEQAITPGTISMLSLGCSNKYTHSPRSKEPSQFLNNRLGRFEVDFIQLIQSLSVLLLQAVALDWKATSFTSLVALQIAEISLGFQPGIDAFLLALSSATELRDLKIITIRGISEGRGVMPTKKLSLLKLESLYFEDLPFNILEIFITTIAPGSYHLTVNLFPNFFQSESASDIFESPQVVVAIDDEICALLGRVTIHKLMLLKGNWGLWESTTGLRSLLKSLPTVKILVLDGFELDQDLLKALEKPSKSQVTRSPEFETLEFHCTTIKFPLEALRHGFKSLLASHRIKRLVLGRSYEDESKELAGGEFDGLVEWLKAQISHLSLYEDQTSGPEMYDKWQLWDGWYPETH
ncbi:unnamed protein product [Rhizoctonia solani]|uniref:F-box domain-containing protein n=1 Tax=Rhizoctonia solani TaxID=456999 RepID=A0A8H2Y198_9AGAM|nr:unnamed protein product [Rhizoctonia solani]